MTTSTRQDSQERTARCGYGWTCEAEATDAGNCAEHAELVAVRRAIFRSGQSVPSNATIEELRAMLPIIAGGGPELDADYGHPLHGGAYGAAGCEDCAGQAVVAGAARKAESVAEAARKASADHYDGCGECTWAGTMCAAAVVISDAALVAYIAEARAKDAAYNGPSRFEALLRSTSAAALERVGLTRSGSPIIGGGGPELDDDNRKVAKCRGCLHVGVGWYWNANTGDMRTRCHDAPIDWQPVKRGPAIAGGGPELDADDERIEPDTIHKCADGCGFLVRHGEPHICEPMCNCRPRTGVLGTPWNHTPGCAYEVEPDLWLRHSCSHCPPDADKAQADARTQEIVTSAHALDAAGDTVHAVLTGGAAELLRAARSRLALTNRDARLLLWRAEAIRLMGHHDYGRGFKVDDLITPAALAEAIQLRSIPPIIGGGGPELDERPDCGRAAPQPCNTTAPIAGGCTIEGGCDADPCPVCGCSTRSGWTCETHREDDDPNTIGFLTAEDGVICAGCAAEYGGGRGGEWPPVLANVIYEYDVDPCPDCGKAVDDWPTLGMIAAGQAALGPHRWKRGALDIIACEDCGDLAGPLGMGSTRRDCRGRLGAA